MKTEKQIQEILQVKKDERKHKYTKSNVHYCKCMGDGTCLVVTLSSMGNSIERQFKESGFNDLYDLPSNSTEFNNAYKTALKSFEFAVNRIPNSIGIRTQN